MISDIRVVNFRSYVDSAFEFEPGVNIIVGPNASGKTNLLEAILLLHKGSTYRSNDQLIKHSMPWAKIESTMSGKPRSVRLKNENEKTVKEFHINGDKLKRLPFNRRIPIVVFEPSHLQLLTDSPEKRRVFIDDILEQTTMGFDKKRRDYKRILGHRNAILKHNPTPEQMFVWDVRLSELGAQIANERISFIDQNNEKLKKLYKKLTSKKHEASLQYQTTVAGKDYGSGMLKNLKIKFRSDSERGFTSVGVHRDDMLPILDGHELMQTGSRGEVRTMLLALKLLELSAVEASSGNKPILLLDDVFSELDGARRRALTSYLQDHQTFITTTDADIVVQHFLDNCHVIPVGAN